MVRLDSPLGAPSRDPGLTVSTSMTPNWSAVASGWRIPATVTPAPEAMWSATICDGSMR